MSEKPLSRLDPAKPVIVLCTNTDEFTQVRNSYGMDPLLDNVVAVYGYDDAVLASTLYPNDSPWCVGASAATGELYKAAEFMRSYFGQAKTQSEAFQAQNMEYAIHPRRLDQPPST